MSTHYPAALDVAEDLLIAVNNFATKCVGNVSPSQIGIAVQSVLGLPPSGVVSINNEVIFYEFINSSGANPVLSNCSRGYDGTTPATHVNSSKVELRWVATHHNTLNAAIRAIQATLGINPHGSFTDLAAKLAVSFPVFLPRVSGTVWTFTHPRKRLVAIQLWRLVAANQYEIFDAPINQLINPAGDSTVTIELPAAEEGYVIYT